MSPWLVATTTSFPLEPGLHRETACPHAPGPELEPPPLDPLPDPLELPPELPELLPESVALPLELPLLGPVPSCPPLVEEHAVTNDEPPMSTPKLAPMVHVTQVFDRMMVPLQWWSGGKE